LDNNEFNTCQNCDRQIIEIDHYGQRLIGCLDCNRWSWEGSKRLFMELPEQDLQDLRERVTAR
jgi:hypothetical protein